MLVTELVPGSDHNLESAVTVRLPDGSYPLAYGRRKLRQHPRGTGVGSLFVSAEVPETMALTRALLDHAGFAGLSGLEAKRHEGTDERVLIEINVRAPAGFGLGEACGVEAAWRTYAVLAAIPLGPQRPQVNGRKAVIPYLDLLAARNLIARDELSLWGWAASYRGTRSAGVLDPRDPGPALAVARRLVALRRAKRSAQRSGAPGAAATLPGAQSAGLSAPRQATGRFRREDSRDIVRDTAHTEPSPAPATARLGDPMLRTHGLDRPEDEPLWPAPPGHVP